MLSQNIVQMLKYINEQLLPVYCSKTKLIVKGVDYSDEYELTPNNNIIFISELSVQYDY